MTTYVVLKHKNGYEIKIKNGFSWVFFFFGMFVFLYHKMWSMFFAYMGGNIVLLYFLSSLYGYVKSSNESVLHYASKGLGWVYILFNIFISIVIACFINKHILLPHYRKKGYSDSSDIQKIRPDESASITTSVATSVVTSPLSEENVKIHPSIIIDPATNSPYVINNPASVRPVSNDAVTTNKEVVSETQPASIKFNDGEGCRTENYYLTDYTILEKEKHTVFVKNGFSFQHAVCPLVAYFKHKMYKSVVIHALYPIALFSLFYFPSSASGRLASVIVTVVFIAIIVQLVSATRANRLIINEYIKRGYKPVFKDYIPSDPFIKY